MEGRLSAMSATKSCRSRRAGCAAAAIASPRAQRVLRTCLTRRSGDIEQRQRPASEPHSAPEAPEAPAAALGGAPWGIASPQAAQRPCGALWRCADHGAASSAERIPQPTSAPPRGPQPLKGDARQLHRAVSCAHDRLTAIVQPQWRSEHRTSRLSLGEGAAQPSRVQYRRCARCGRTAGPLCHSPQRAGSRRRSAGHAMDHTRANVAPSERVTWLRQVACHD